MIPTTDLSMLIEMNKDPMINTFGHLLLSQHGKIEFENETYWKNMMVGVVFSADLGLGENWELWITGVVYQSNQRRTGHKYHNERIDKILLNNWANPINWPEEKEVRTLQGLAHLIVSEVKEEKETEETKDFFPKKRKYMVAGSIIGKSCEVIEEGWEIWSGTTLLLPQERYTIANAPDPVFRNGIQLRRIDQWLLSKALTDKKLWGEPVATYWQRIPPEWLLDSVPLIKRYQKDYVQECLKDFF